MTLAYILVLLSVIGCTSPPPPTSSSSRIQRISIHRSDNHWVMSFICLQQIKSCSFEFVELPQGWTESDGKIKVPLTNIRKIQERKIIVNVGDGTESQSKEEIKLQIDTNKIMIVSKKVLGQPGAQQSAVPNPIQTGSLEPTDNFVLKDQQDLTWLQINGISPFLPTISYLDQIIASGDQVFISKVFQNIMADKSQCQKRKQYLEDVLARLSKHILYNQKIVQKQERMTKKSSEELVALEEEHRKMKEEMEEMKKMGTGGNQKKEKQLKEKRQINLSKHYSLKLIAGKYERRLEELKGNLEGNQDVEQLKAEIKKQEEEIDQINKELDRLNKRKADLFNKLDKKRNQIAHTKVKVNPNKSKIESLEKKYKQYMNRSQSYKKFAQTATRQLEAMQKQGEKWGEKMKTMKAKLSQIEEKLLSTQSFVQNPFIDEVITIISTLKSHKQKVQEASVKCEEPAPIKKVSSNLLSSLTFTSYPNNLPEDVQESQLPSRESFHHLYPKLKKLNIFSMNWILKYGVPSTFAFTCQEKNPISGYGMITAINKGSIRVEDEEGNVNALYLGSCSELEAEQEDFVPEMGDVIEWEGNLVVSGIVNLFRARLFRNESRK